MDVVLTISFATTMTHAIWLNSESLIVLLSLSHFRNIVGHVYLTNQQESQLPHNQACCTQK
jgi:hypothetical protein